MNPESLKSELQQVLENDLLLRKEFTEMRRSLSDYRNQLIMRDEDCKRLQVTIDVLNTKLSVFERDNTGFKTEIEGLRDAQDVLTTELAIRQRELEERTAEIASLREELGRLTAEYERRTDEIRQEAGQQLMKLREQYNEEVTGLENLNSEAESAIRAHYEMRLAELCGQWTEKERELTGSRENEQRGLKQSHAEELAMLREQYNATLAGLSATNHEQQADLKLRYETTIIELEQRLSESQGEIAQRHEEEMNALRASVENERAALAHQFDLNLEAIAAEYAEREQRARNGYETRIAELKSELTATTEELTLSLEQRIAAVKLAHEEVLSQASHVSETRIAEVTNLYEERIANLLIHSNATNSRLYAELEQLRAETEGFIGLIADLNGQIEARDQSICMLTERVGELEMQLFNEQEKSLALAGQLENAGAAADADEVALLRDEMARQNHVHSDYVNELNATIAVLNDEVQNMSCVFTTVANDLGVAESTIEDQSRKLTAAYARIAVLENEVAASAEIQAGPSIQEMEAKLAARDLAYNKLLAENEGLIAEIEEIQRQCDAGTEELSFVRSELNDQKQSFEARVAELKETLDFKNNELSVMTTRNGALEKELTVARQEIADLSGVLSGAVGAETDAEITRLRHTIENLNAELEVWRSQPAQVANDDYEVITGLRQEVDSLNTQLLALLEEKEQMAGQLLKMNDVVGRMSQQVDPEHIDVSGLNNHRTNTILAGSSMGADKPAVMKKQINELVREIDKCIALLSA